MISLSLESVALIKTGVSSFFLVLKCLQTRIQDDQSKQILYYSTTVNNMFMLADRSAWFALHHCMSAEIDTQKELLAEA